MENRLSREQRAFIAGVCSTELMGRGLEPDPSKLPQFVDEAIERGQQSLRGMYKDSAMGAIAWRSITERIDAFILADENHFNSQLAQQGPNCALPLSQYGPAEWKGAVTALAMYRYWLQRELSAANDFLSSRMVQSAPELCEIADNAAEGARQALGDDLNKQAVDPVWARRLLRRLVAEAEALVNR